MTFLQEAKKRPHRRQRCPATSGLGTDGLHCQWRPLPPTHRRMVRGGDRAPEGTAQAFSRSSAFGPAGLGTETSTTALPRMQSAVAKLTGFHGKRRRGDPPRQSGGPQVITRPRRCSICVRIISVDYTRLNARGAAQGRLRTRLRADVSILRGAAGALIFRIYHCRFPTANYVPARNAQDWLWADGGGSGITPQDSLSATDSTATAWNIIVSAASAAPKDDACIRSGFR